MLESRMVRTIEAIFDGKVLRPETLLALEPNTRVRITIEEVEPRSEEATSFLDVAQSLNLEGPPDWAENIESYLYDRESQHEE
jgi:hypothetical protein